jgi:NitT/TauT family transport system substrate-binding protein
MKKLIIFILTSLTVLLPLSSRSAAEVPSEQPVQVRLVVPTGATLATVAMMKPSNPADGYEVKMDVIGSSDLIAARIISGEADFAVIPSNLAAVLANKGTGIRLAGPAIWGLNYIVTSENLSDWEDLRGKTVNMIGRGLTPDITFRHLLTENGLVPDKDVEIVYASAATELAPAFLTGRNKVSMMPEPMITTVLSKKPDTRILVDVQKEWRRLYGTSYPQASLVVSSKFQKEHPEYTEQFIREFARSVAAAVDDPVSAGKAVAVIAPEMNAEIMAMGIPRMNLEFVGAVQARASLEAYFKVLESYDPASIGGKLPSDDFYIP